MPLQETFEIVARHLLAQGKRSVLKETPDTCAYRGEGGLKCAVGCLIPDELYRPSFEGATCHSFPVAPVLIKLGHNVTFCSTLQRIHDFQPPKDWRLALLHIGRIYKLDTAFLEAKQGE